MSIWGHELLPTLDDSAVPMWRQCLRGLSCCAFQTNELTGVIFVAAVLVYSWHMAVLFVLAVVVGTVTAVVLSSTTLFGTATVTGYRDAGILGFNAALMGLALGNFFVLDVALWITVVVMAAFVAAVTVVSARWLPFPFLAAPFIAGFWLLWPVTTTIGLHEVALSAWPVQSTSYLPATIASMGSTLFAPVGWAGALFLLGVLVSNWRHAVVAAGGGLIAVALAIHVHVVGGAIKSGYVGFNAVLAALVVYIVVAPDLRLAALGAFIATWIFSYMNRSFPAPALASGFVLGVWTVMALSWLNVRFVTARATGGPSSTEEPTTPG